MKKTERGYDHIYDVRWIVVSLWWTVQRVSFCLLSTYSPILQKHFCNRIIANYGWRVSDDGAWFMGEKEILGGGWLVWGTGHLVEKGWHRRWLFLVRNVYQVRQYCFFIYWQILYMLVASITYFVITCFYWIK